MTQSNSTKKTKEAKKKGVAQTLEQRVSDKSVPKDLARVVSKYMGKDTKYLSKSEKGELYTTLRKYFSNDKIRIEAVCLANGGRSPAIMSVLAQYASGLGIDSLVELTSSGTKTDKVRGDRNDLPAKLKHKVLIAAQRYRKNVREFYNAEDKEKVRYILEHGSDVRDFEKAYRSDSTFKSYVDTLDKKAIRELHIAEANFRDQTLEEIGAKEQLDQLYYKGRQPSKTYSMDWTEFAAEFYTGRHQTQAGEKVFVASDSNRAADVVTINESAGNANYTVIDAKTEGTIGDTYEQYKAKTYALQKMVVQKSPQMILDYYAISRG